MTYEGFGGDCLKVTLQTCAGNFLVMSMGGRAEGLACADLGARTPIGVSGNLSSIFICGLFTTLALNGRRFEIEF